MPDEPLMAIFDICTPISPSIEIALMIGLDIDLKIILSFSGVLGNLHLNTFAKPSVLRESLTISSS